MQGGKEPQSVTTGSSLRPLPHPKENFYLTVSLRLLCEDGCQYVVIVLLCFCYFRSSEVMDVASTSCDDVSESQKRMSEKQKRMHRPTTTCGEVVLHNKRRRRHINVLPSARNLGVF